MMEPRGPEPLPPACHEVAKSDATYFAIPYAENDKLGFFDTKSGITLVDAKEKLSGLREFLASKENYFGGLVSTPIKKIICIHGFILINALLN